MSESRASHSVLLVEDNPGDAGLIREYLEESPGEGYDLTHVTRLDEAVQALDGDPADLVLLDLRLPDGSGLETLARVHAAAAGAPIVVLSGNSDERLALACIDAGAQDYLIKEELRPHSLRRALGYALTRRREAEARDHLSEQLRHAQKMEAVGTLAGGVAHEFNNVLAVIAGSATLARTELPADHPAQLAFAEIEKAVVRGADVVRQILTFSRREGEAKRLVVQLRSVVDQTVRLLRATLPANVEIVSTAGTDVPPVEADATQIHQILLNLATNAAHAMSDDGGLLEIRLDTVDVAASDPALSAEIPAGRYARLSVRDTGRGMDAPTLSRVFEPFFTTKEPGEGTGLGLAVVHGIVKNHGGAVTAFSQPGRGTVFHLYLPAATGTVAPAEAPAPDAPPCGGGRILFVDDEKAIVTLYTRLLQRLGYEVAGFDRPADAIAAFRADPTAFDLVVTDLSMPRIDGPKLVREVLDVRPGTPIVMATGFIADEDSERTRQIGVRELVRKPYTVELLAGVIERLLSDGPPPEPAS